MTIRIIDNKKIDLTEDEFKLYQEITESYNTSRFKGSDLFKGLFETDANGILIFLRPPNKTHSSMEVFLYLMSVMTAQHLRISVTEHDKMIAELKIVKEELNEAKKEYNDLIGLLKQIKK